MLRTKEPKSFDIVPKSDHRVLMADVLTVVNCKANAVMVSDLHLSGTSAANVGLLLESGCGRGKHSGTPLLEQSAIAGAKTLLRCQRQV